MAARESSLALTDSQREMVLEYFAGGEIRPVKAAAIASIVAMAFAFLLAGAGISLLIRVTGVLSGAWALPSAMVCTAAVGIAVFAHRLRFEKKSSAAERRVSDEVQVDLQAGRVAVVEVSPEAVACISEHGSEGAKYCYRIDNGRVLILREEDLVFESSLGRDYGRALVRILSLPNSGMILSVELSGENLQCDYLAAEVDEHRYPSGRIIEAEWKEVLSGGIVF